MKKTHNFKKSNLQTHIKFQKIRQEKIKNSTQKSHLKSIHQIYRSATNRKMAAGAIPSQTANKIQEIAPIHIEGRFEEYIHDVNTQQILFRDMIREGCAPWMYNNEGNKLHQFFYIGPYCGLTFKQYYNMEFKRDPPLNIDSRKKGSEEKLIIDAQVMLFNDRTAAKEPYKIQGLMQEIVAEHQRLTAVVNHAKAILYDEGLNTESFQTIEESCDVDQMLQINLEAATKKAIDKLQRKHQVFFNAAGWKYIQKAIP